MMRSAVFSLAVFSLTVAVLAASCPKDAGPKAAAAGEEAGVKAGRDAEAEPPPVTRPEPVLPLDVVQWTGKFSPEWKQYDKLTKEQKYEAAGKIVEKLLDRARAEKKSEEWVRCLVRTVQLRTALHGYETSVRFLKDQPWPEDLLGRSVLNLYYADLLVIYAQSYSWEIRKREKVESKGAVDLKAWTMEQIYEEAQRAYEEVWKHRDQLGEHPISVLKTYVNKNNYPDKIRPTLRDAVSYMRAELLADTGGWRPEQQNEIYKLDVKALLGPRQLAAAALTDPAVHPILKICAILDDLERWHEGRGEKEAAFESRIARIRQLHSNFTEKADRLACKENLKRALDAARQLQWWAVGQALLAEITRDEDAADSLVRARELALAGQEAFPDSIGGRRCLHIVKAIEAPDYDLEAMTSDAPGRRSIVVNYKNLKEIFFRVYPFNLKKFIESSDDYNILPDYRELNNLLANSKPAFAWSVELPPTPDYRVHKHHVTPPMTEPGFYVVVASGRKKFPKADNKIVGLNMTIGDLVLVSEQGGGELFVTALSGATGRPKAGVEVSLYQYDWTSRHKKAEGKKTGSDGTIHFKRNHSNANYFLFASDGKNVAIDSNYIYLYSYAQPAEATQTLIYTDRSIYRPLQKVMFKVVAYKGRYDLANFKIAADERVTVSLMDANYQKVETKNLTTNQYGTASGEFNIPAGRLLGQWRIETSPYGNAFFRVEEYKRPTFEVKLLDPKEQMRLNRPATLKGEARYYFGLPVASAKISWRVARAPVYPYWWHWYYWGYQPPERTQTVATGTAEMKDDGTFTLTFTPEADERLGETEKELTYRYSVTTDVTDEGGETRSASRAFRLGFVAVEAAVKSDVEFFMENAGAEMPVLRTNLDGAPAAGKGAYRIVALAQPQKTLLPSEQPIPRAPAGKEGQGYRTEGDLLRPRFNSQYSPEAALRDWADAAEIGKGKLDHDEKGEAKVRVPGLAPGAYRLHYTTTDAFGSEYKMKHEFIVAGKQTKIALPAFLRVERPSVGVGETARILAVSGLPGQLVFLQIFKDAKRVEQRMIEAGTDPALIEIPVTEKERGGFGLTLWVMNDHQFMQFSRTVFVPWDNKELDVEFSTFRDKLRPGEKEKWTVKVTGPGGKDTAVTAAELLAYMYDRSLDAFAPHLPPSPLGLFPNRSSIAAIRATLGRAWEIWAECRGWAPLPGYPDLHGDNLVFYSGYGIGGPGRRGGGGGVFYDRELEQTAMPAGAPRASGGARMKVARMAKSEAAAPAEEMAFEADSADMVMAEGKDKGGEKRLEAGDGRTAAEAPVEMRTDFSETAFFRPHLITGSDGSAQIEFEVPDSVTSWNVYVHAITKELASGTLKKETRSVKELMVRPYLPRFLREGDEAALKVVVNNASDKPFEGRLDFDILDPDTEKSVMAEFGLKKEEAQGRPFKVEAGKGADLSFAVRAPARIGLVAFKVIARAGNLSDGELRPIPLLPGRMHLIQSRFVTLRDKDRRVMTFEDMAKNDDPTLIQDQLVVTIDAQLFYSVLAALPYLVEYPYECTEQLLNRFISTGILSSLYKRYPAVAAMAEKLKSRKTEYESWAKEDPNRKMALEETPWVQMAKGGPERDFPLVNVLDPAIAAAHRDASLAKLKKAQTSSGAFPWFPGGPPSPFMTLYILYGFSKAIEFGVDVPRDVMGRAWAYMHRHYLDEIVHDMIAEDCCWEFVTFLNYTLSNYPDVSWTGGVFTDEERKTMLDFSFRHWKRHSPYLKGYLALTLHRMDRKKDAVLVWESVMDSAKTEKDQGTHWAPEDRGWLWYNDTIETHAFAIRTLLEIMPKEPKLDGLVLWLFLNKKLNHWKSTKATAEAIYSLAKYLKQTEQLAVKEEMDVTVGDLKKHFTFLPDEFTGQKNQIVIPGEQILPQKSSTVIVEKATKGFALASATWHFSTEKLPEEARGDFLTVTRSFFKRVKTGREVTLEPLKEGAKIEVGDEVEVHISITSKHPMEYVHLRDPRPAGFEPVSLTSSHKWNLGIYWYEEVRDSGMNFFFERLPQGEYPFKHRMLASVAGTFKVAPATIQPMYAPEFAAYSAGAVVGIRPAD